MNSNKEQETPQNNLNELNDVFFNTMRGLVDGTVDEKKAKTVATLGTAIINNAKVQLEGFKLTGGRTTISALPQSEAAITSKPEAKQPALPISKKEDEAQLQYAKFLGYKNVAEAIVTLPKGQFLQDFRTWQSTFKNQD